MKHSHSKGIFQDKTGSKALITAVCIGLGACGASGGKQTEKFIYTSGRPVYGTQPGTDAVASLWEAGEYGYVRIVQAEDGPSGANDHPVSLTSEQVEKTLEQLQIQKGKKDPQPLFTQRELDRLAKPLAEALAKAQPNQDVVFSVADRESGVLSSIVNPLLMTTGRVFYKDGALHLILGTVGTPFESQLRATGVMPKFKSGSRNNPTQIEQQILLGPAMAYAASGREDWIRMDSRASSIPSSQIGTSSQIATERTSSPIGPVAATPPPASIPAETSLAPDDRDETFYQQAETRLKGLKRLREQGLLTEQEYQEKRQAIIDNL